jgi:hypothetical protein
MSAFAKETWEGCPALILANIIPHDQPPVSEPFSGSRLLPPCCAICLAFFTEDPKSPLFSDDGVPGFFSSIASLPQAGEGAGDKITGP